MKWAVEVLKTELENKNLQDLLKALGFSLIESEALLITSPEFDQYTTAQEVWQQAKRIREAFTGPTNIDPGFTIGAVFDYSSDIPKRHSFIEAEAGLYGFTQGSGTASVQPPDGLTDGEIADWHVKREEQEYQLKLQKQRDKLESAYYSSRASQVLSLLSLEQQTGETLYKIYEIMVGSKIKSQRIQFRNQFGITEDQYNRFQDTVHNPDVSGNWARHGMPESLKSNDPMSKHEAEVFIRNLADRWLNYIRVSKSY